MEQSKSISVKGFSHGQGIVATSPSHELLAAEYSIFRQKHIASGLYIITKQQDLINEAGFSTSLDMVKIAEDEG